MTTLQLLTAYLNGEMEYPEYVSRLRELQSAAREIDRKVRRIQAGRRQPLAKIART